MSASPSPVPWTDPAPARVRRAKVDRPPDSDHEPAQPRRIVGKREAERYARLFLAALIRRYCTLRLHGDEAPYAVWASNETLAEEFGLTAKQLRLRLKTLKALDLILVFRSNTVFRQWIELDAGPNLGVSYPQGRRRNRGRVIVVRQLLPDPIRDPGYGPLGYRDPVTTEGASATAPTGPSVVSTAEELLPAAAPEPPPVAVDNPASREGLRQPSEDSTAVTEGECAIALEGECAIALEGARHGNLELNKIETNVANGTSSTSSLEYVPEIDVDALRASLDPAELAEIDAELATIKSTIVRFGRFLEVVKQRKPEMEFPTRLVAVRQRPTSPVLSQGNPRAGSTKPLDAPVSGSGTEGGKFAHHTDTAAQDAAKRVKWLAELKDLVRDLPSVAFKDRLGHLERLTEQLRHYLGDRNQDAGDDFHGYLLDVWTRKISAEAMTSALDRASAPSINNPAGYFLTLMGRIRARQRPTAKAPKTSAAGRENQETPLLALS